MDLRESLLRGLVARDLLRDVGSALGTRGIPWTALKGAALHASGCRKAEERPVEDVDVLVPAARLGDALEALGVIGLVGVARSASTVTLARPGLPIPVDLHHRLFAPNLFRLDTAGVLRRARRHGELWLPDPLDLYAHLVGHFAKGRLGAADTVHLGDFARVAEHFRLDSSVVARHLEQHGLARAARYTLSLASVLAGDEFAAAVLGSLPRDRVGGGLAFGARFVMPRTRSRLVATLAVHSLNDTLVRGALSWALHAKEAVRRRVRGGAT